MMIFFKLVSIPFPYKGLLDYVCVYIVRVQITLSLIYAVCDCLVLSYVYVVCIIGPYCISQTVGIFRLCDVFRAFSFSVIIRAAANAMPLPVCQSVTRRAHSHSVAALNGGELDLPSRSRAKGRWRRRRWRGVGAAEGRMDFRKGRHPT